MYRLQWSWWPEDVSLLERCPHFNDCTIYIYPVWLCNSPVQLLENGYLSIAHIHAGLQ